MLRQRVYNGMVTAESNWRNEYPDEDEYGEETPRDLAHDGWREMADEEVRGC